MRRLIPHPDPSDVMFPGQSLHPFISFYYSGKKIDFAYVYDAEGNIISSKIYCKSQGFNFLYLTYKDEELNVNNVGEIRMLAKDFEDSDLPPYFKMMAPYRLLSLDSQLH